MQVESRAKINLFLDIVGKDPADGYHFLDSLFQEVTLADSIEIEENKIGEDRVVFTGLDISGNTTVHKALSRFKSRFGISRNYNVTVRKKIPAGAGLGGGSSNAAAVLSALAEMNGTGFSELPAIGASIGSDVPFFYTADCAGSREKGKRLSR